MNKSIMLPSLDLTIWWVEQLPHNLKLRLTTRKREKIFGGDYGKKLTKDYDKISSSKIPFFKNFDAMS